LRTQLGAGVHDEPTPQQSERIVAAAGEQEPTARSIGGTIAVVTAILLILAQAILAITLTLFILSIANDMAGGGIGRDELRRFGDGPKLAFASAWLPPMVGGLVGIVLLAGPLYKRAWLVPVIAMVVSVALWGYFISTFEYVPPRGG
jgi:hypothetical protein